ncbi:phosphocholine cytidylyltransferase family protein [Deltaproteobacteria bacterium TL4]
MAMKAIIIAAGFGKRLGELTKDNPKCLLKIAGTSILENTIRLLRKAGIQEIAIVVGYLAEKIKLENVHYFQNADYQNNNVLHSLMYARSFMNEDTVIIYSDIWIEEPLITQISLRTEEVVVSVDSCWEETYLGRTDHPVEQAENALYDAQGRLLEIGKHINPRNVKEGQMCGEFIGLFKLSKNFCQTFIQVFEEIDARYRKAQPFQKSLAWEKAYLTDFFSELLDRGYPVCCNLHQKQWFEVDTVQDYNKLLQIMNAKSQRRKERNA